MHIYPGYCSGVLWVSHNSMTMLQMPLKYIFQFYTQKEGPTHQIVGVGTSDSKSETDTILYIAVHQVILFTVVFNIKILV